MSSGATTADRNGRRWSGQARDWARYWGTFADPARHALIADAEIAGGVSVLDVGCGSGELLALAAGAAATVAGLDAAPEMVAIARERLGADADLRVGAIERLPWPAASFDVVTAVNSLQFTADRRRALAELIAVVRPGGRVAIGGWGPAGAREVAVLFDALSTPAVASADTSADAPPPLGEPGVLEALMVEAGLELVAAADVAVPYTPATTAELEGGLRVTAGLDDDATTEQVERGVAAALRAAAPYRRPDGSYRFENTFTHVVGRRRRG